jgi:hypothetical protein
MIVKGWFHVKQPRDLANTAVPRETLSKIAVSRETVSPNYGPLSDGRLRREILGGTDCFT